MEGYILLKVCGGSRKYKTVEFTYQIPSHWQIDEGVTAYVNHIMNIQLADCFMEDGTLAVDNMDMIFKLYSINLWAPVNQCPKDLKDYIRYGDTVINRLEAMKIMKKYGYCDNLAQKIYNHLSQYDRYRVYRDQLLEYIR